jgi:hypothetical protein
MLVLAEPNRKQELNMADQLWDGQCVSPFVQGFVGDPLLRGLAADLLRGNGQPIPALRSNMQSLGDTLLAMQNPSLQSRSAALPGVQPIDVPTGAPAGVAQGMPVAATAPNKPIPSSGDDKAALTELIESKRPDLGLEGDAIRSLLRPGFTQDRFDNYWEGSGQGFQLSGPRFKDIPTMQAR